MKRSLVFLLVAFFILSGLRPFPILANDKVLVSQAAENNKTKEKRKHKEVKKEEKAKEVEAEITLTPEWVNGDRQSAKFNEYREIISGVKGGFGVSLNTNKYLLEINANNIQLVSNAANHLGDLDEDDRHMDVETSFYNSFKAGLTYDQIPHRFAYDAKTLYSGVDTGNLSLGTAMGTTVQSYLQAATSPLDLVTRLNAVFPTANNVDLELFRKRWGFDIQSTGIEPFTIGSNLKWEHREGDRPIFATFGFSNTVEIPEPINYDTFSGKVAAEYNEKPFFLKGTYTISSFNNNIPTITWANPFRAVDNYFNTSGYAANYTEGAAAGRYAGYPDNNYHDFSFTGSWHSDSPFKQRLTAFGSWGWMGQNAPLIPYTTNTAIVPNAFVGIPAANNPPCVASLLSCLYATDGGVTNVNARVGTTLYNVTYTAKPFDFLNITGRYRYYDYNDTTTQITFAGYARVDAVWESELLAKPGPPTNTPFSFHHTTWEGEASLDLTKRTRFIFNYMNDKWNRKDREVSQSTEDFYKASIESREFNILDFRGSYETSTKNGLTATFDPTAAANFFACYPWLQNNLNPGQYNVYVDGFGGCPGTPVPAYQYPPLPPGYANTLALYTPPTILPWLRKYDEAGYTHDQVNLLATLMPTDSFSLTAQVINGHNNYNNSLFGLLYDKRNLWSVEGDFEAAEGVNLYASYAREGNNNKQAARQWNPNCPAYAIYGGVPSGFADPYCGADRTLFSYSNWSAESTDLSNTIGAGIKAQIIPDKFRMDADYLLTNETGLISFNSPLGTAGVNDLNAFVPIDFPAVDNSRLNTFNLKFTYDLNSGNTLTLGYMWENLTVNDFDLSGFTYFPVGQTGTYNGALMMGTFPKGYDVSSYWGTYTVRF